MNKTKSLYHEFKTPINAFIDAEDIGVSETLPCEIIAINVYPNEAITFSIIVDGSLYDYISPENLNFKEQLSNHDKNFALSLKDLVYNNNLSENFVVFKSNVFSKRKLICYFKYANTWLSVKKYYFSIDWLFDNDKRHFVLLENGQFAFVPNHKIKLDGKQVINKKFQKIRKDYVV